MNIFLITKKNYDKLSYRYIHKYRSFYPRKEYTRLKLTKGKYDQAEFAALYNMLQPIKNIHRQIKIEISKNYKETGLRYESSLTHLIYRVLRQSMKYNHYDIIRFLHRNNKQHKIYFIYFACENKNIQLIKKYRKLLS